MVASTSTTGSRSGKAPLPASAEPPQAAALHAKLRRLIASSRQRLAGAVKTEPARQFYASQAATDTWSVRELRHPIERKAFERTELAALQTHTPAQAELVETTHTNPAQVFKDPYFLDFLGLRQGHDEADLEAAILRQLEAFILELGRVPASSCAPNPAANRWNYCKSVAEYWTELPPKAALEQKLHTALLEVRERLARRVVLLGELDDE